MAIHTLLDTADRLTDMVFFGDRLASGAAVPSARIINTGFGLKGGGDLSVNRTISVNDVVNGYNVLNHGAVADGTTDNTAAYTAIFGLADQGVLVFPPGAYAGSLNLPDSGDTRNGNWSVVGAGIYDTVLIPAAANTPAIKKAVRNTGVIQGATFGGFTVKAHASGSTGPAIDLPGFRSCRFQDIAYSSNAGGDFASMFHFSSAQMGCYANKLSHIVIDGGTVQNTGPATVFLFDIKDDSGTAHPNDINAPANDHEIEDCFIFSNTGIGVVFDCLRSAAVVIQNNFMESNPGTKYVILGTGTVVNDGNHFESGDTDNYLVFNSISGEGASNNCTIDGNDFSDISSITVPADCADNVFGPRNTVFSLGSLTISDSGTNNIFLQGNRVLSGTPITKHSGSTGSAPSLMATNLGTGGTVTLFSGSNDTDGIILLNFGTSVPDLQGVVSFTFAEPFIQFPSVIISPGIGSLGDAWTIHANKPIQVGSVDNTGFQVFWSNGSIPADNSRYQINYHVKGLPD